MVILLLGIQLNPICAIRCYKCDGPSGTACYDKFNPSGDGISMVESTTGWCIKQKGQFLGLDGITRDADTSESADACTKSECTKVNIPFFGNGIQCCCNTDLCNSTVRLSSTMAIGIILLLFVLTFKKFMF